MHPAALNSPGPIEGDQADIRRARPPISTDMSREQVGSMSERSQALADQVARNIQSRRELLTAPGLGLLKTSERVWAIAREAAQQAKARQNQANSGGTDVIA